MTVSAPTPYVRRPWAWTRGPARPIFATASAAFVASAFFGVCCTTFVWFVNGHDYQWQVLASAIKIPTILGLSSLIAFPLLHAVVRALGVRAPFSVVWAATLEAVAATAFVLGALGPVVAISSVTRNYTFVILACYGAFGLAVLVGAVFLTLALRRAPWSAGKAIPLACAWAVLFGAGVAEIGWSIRPIVGWTGQPFEWFRKDATRLDEQVRAEFLNLFQFGGLPFPENQTEPQDGAAAR